MSLHTSIPALAACTALTALCAPASGQGPPLCPEGATGSCTAPHSTPGCENPLCCELVCAFDAFCCAANWDAYCAFVIAPALCTSPPPVPCGLASSGPCDQVHTTPSCSDAACCEYVCLVVPSCCTVGWDAQCVSLANSGCSSQCDPTCPAGALVETELCAAQTNTACVGGQPNPELQELPGGVNLCGKIQWTGDGVPDVDAYKFTVSDPDGNGLAKVTLSFAAKAPAFIALTQDPCGTLSAAPMHAQVSGCSSATEVLCVPPGTWYAIAARGTFPTPLEFTETCSSFQRYVAQVAWSDQCVNPCGSVGDCYASHSTPGCDSSPCCALVCATDPLCCDKSWDQLCADEALDVCSPAPPLNDSCDAARPIGLGSSPFTLAGATPSPIPVPAGCLTLGGTSVGADVWFRVDDLRGNVTLSTCSADAIDSVLIVYADTCGTLPIACDDDNSQCGANPNSALVTFAAECHMSYLVRVAATAGQAGSGTITVSSTLSPCPGCPADINDDERVDGLDLAVVLSGWGLPGSGDIDGSGTVDGVDMTAILSGWGDCP